MIQRRASVRTIVESVMRTGNLLRESSVKRMLEGVRGHQSIQAAGGDDVQNEVAVSLVYRAEHIELTVYGRIDRLFADGTLEEIKTTLRPMLSESDVNPQHRMQAMFYAHMLAERDGLDAVPVRLCYLNLADGEITAFSHAYTRQELADAVGRLITPFLAGLEAQYLHFTDAKAELAARGFPFAAYRPGQRALAEQVYTAIREKRALLAESPTGTGKTMAVLFPALKAFSEGLTERVFYLTARTTQQQAALDAVERLDLSCLSTLVITARDKICFYDTPLCAAGDCPYADGYYDRMPACVSALSKEGGVFTADRIRAAARASMLCPFELSLDLALSADLILCDYNYAFDPRVRLIRFFAQGRNRSALLVDEAHNLPDRARGMYSAQLCEHAISAYKKTVEKPFRRDALYQSLTALSRAIRALFAEAAEPHAEKEAPASLAEPAGRALGLLQASEPHGDRALFLQLMFDLSAFVYVLSAYDDAYVTLYEGGRGARRVTLFCADPSGRLSAAFKKCGAVLFSATLSPYTFYRTLSGLPDDAPMFALPSPFPPENLLVLRLSLSTRYRARERTLLQAADAVAAFLSARRDGNFMIYLPSYAYLRMFHEALLPLVPDARLLVQAPAMDDATRAAFLAAFSPAPQGITAGLAVLGGVFAEGVDLPAERLCGAAILGVGLPQLCLERDTLRDAFEKSYGAGYDYAYRYPGVGRVLQAAGRIIRTETDRGALLLIDDRYQSDAYRELLPASWLVEPVWNAAMIRARAEAFFARKNTP